MRRGHPAASVRFVGGRRGIEGRVVPEAGFAIDLLAGRGLQRRLTLANVAAIAGAVVGVRARAPCSSAGTGRASWSASAATRRCRASRRRACCACRRSCTSRTRRPASPTASACGSARAPRCRCPARRCPARRSPAIPCGRSIAAIEREPGTRPALLAVYGGAQGARTINRAAIGCYDRWRDRRDLTVRHVCGPRNLDECEAVARRATARGRRARSYELVRLRAAHGRRCSRGRRSRCAGRAPAPSPS